MSRSHHQCLAIFAEVSNVILNAGDGYRSVFGARQQTEMNVFFDSKFVEAELDHAVEEIDRRGGSDAVELRELIAEIRSIYQSDEPLQRGSLARYVGVLQNNGWISRPIAGTLLSQLIGV